MFSAERSADTPRRREETCARAVSIPRSERSAGTMRRREETCACPCNPKRANNTHNARSRTQPHAAARTHRSEERSEPSRKKRAQRATADSKSFIATQACGASHDSGGMHLRLLAPLVDRLVGGSSVSHQDSASRTYAAVSGSPFPAKTKMQK